MSFQHTLSADAALPALSPRSLSRRALVPVAGLFVLAAFVVVGRRQLHPVADALQRALHASGGWVAAGVGLEVLSLAGYAAVLALAGGRSTRRLGLRASAQVTLAGTAVTRLMPTAGLGGAALTVWTLRRAGLDTRAAARTLVSFFALLYAVFLLALTVSALVLWLDPATSGGARAVSAGAAIVGAGALLAALIVAALARRVSHAPGRSLRARTARGIELVGEAVRSAVAAARTGDVRLLGAPAYWLLDAAVLGAMLHAFGGTPPIAVVALAYLLGQVANTLPLPGSVSGGMTAVLIAFHVPAGLALAAVLSYRTIAVWLPVPLGMAAVPALRRTVAGWAQPCSSCA